MGIPEGVARTGKTSPAPVAARWRVERSKSRQCHRTRGWLGRKAVEVSRVGSAKGYGIRKFPQVRRNILRLDRADSGRSDHPKHALPASPPTGPRERPHTTKRSRTATTCRRERSEPAACQTRRLASVFRAPRILARTCTSDTGLRLAAQRPEASSAISDALRNTHPRTHLAGPGLRTHTRARAHSVCSEARHNQMTKPEQTTKEMRR